MNQDPEDEPLKGSNQNLLRRSLFLLLRRPLVGSFWCSVSGLVGASIVGPFGGLFFHTTLNAEAIFLLGPAGAARGLLLACREIVIGSGLAARVGREVYEKALSYVQDEENPSQNIKEAIENLREKYPLSQLIITGEGVLGFFAQWVLGLFLPQVGQILDEIEKAIDWSEEHEEQLEDKNIIARATVGYLEKYIGQKEKLVTTGVTVLYTSIAGVSFLIGFGIGSLFQ
eukprot:scaffold7281_cov171-Amphora_coffeaeformis.AAC.6